MYELGLKCIEVYRTIEKENFKRVYDEYEYRSTFCSNKVTCMITSFKLYYLFINPSRHAELLLFHYIDYNVWFWYLIPLTECLLVLMEDIYCKKVSKGVLICLKRIWDILFGRNNTSLNNFYIIKECIVFTFRSVTLLTFFFLKFRMMNSILYCNLFLLLNPIAEFHRLFSHATWI